jgi:hypothetical protein
MNYLDRLFGDIEQRYGDAIEWTTLGKLASSLSAASETIAETSAAKDVAAYRAA